MEYNEMEKRKTITLNRKKKKRKREYQDGMIGKDRWNNIIKKVKDSPHR